MLRNQMMQHTCCMQQLLRKVHLRVLVICTFNGCNLPSSLLFSVLSPNKNDAATEFGSISSYLYREEIDERVDDITSHVLPWQQGS